MKRWITGCWLLLLSITAAAQQLMERPAADINTSKAFNAQQLMERPAADINTSKAFKYAEIRTWKFDLPNGVSLVVRPDENAPYVQLRGFCNGGAAGMPAADYYAAIHAGAIIGQSGAGKYSSDTLAAILRNRQINLEFVIEDNRSLINAACKKEDLETLLQLVYLHCTAPQKSNKVYEQYMQQLKNKPQTGLYDLTISNLLNTHAADITPQVIRSISIDKAYHAFQQCFGNANGFTFVITGNLDANGMNNSRLTPLIAKYLGTLPAAGMDKKPAMKPLQVPASRMLRTVKAEDSLMSTTIVFRNNYAFNDTANLQLKIAARIFYKRLVHERRMAGLTLQALSYSLYFYKAPLQQYSWQLSYACAVKEAARMQQVFQSVIKSMQDSITAGEIKDYTDRARQDLKRNFTNNDFWTAYLLGQCYQQEPPDVIAGYPYNYRLATPQTVLQMAKQVWGRKNYIQVTAVPDTKKH